MTPSVPQTRTKSAGSRAAFLEWLSWQHPALWRVRFDMQLLCMVWNAILLVPVVAWHMATGWSMVHMDPKYAQMVFGFLAGLGAVTSATCVFVWNISIAKNQRLLNNYSELGNPTYVTISISALFVLIPTEIIYTYLLSINTIWMCIAGVITASIGSSVFYKVRTVKISGGGTFNFIYAIISFISVYIFLGYLALNARKIDMPRTIHEIKNFIPLELGISFFSILIITVIIVFALNHMGKGVREGRIYKVNGFLVSYVFWGTYALSAGISFLAVLSLYIIVLNAGQPVHDIAHTLFGPSGPSPQIEFSLLSSALFIVFFIVNNVMMTALYSWLPPYVALPQERPTS